MPIYCRSQLTKPRARDHACVASCGARRAGAGVQSSGLGLDPKPPARCSPPSSWSRCPPSWWTALCRWTPGTTYSWRGACFRPRLHAPSRGTGSVLAVSTVHGSGALAQRSGLHTPRCWQQMQGCGFDAEREHGAPRAAAPLSRLRQPLGWRLNSWTPLYWVSGHLLLALNICLRSNS